jgi:predicted amino acid-binding ACT domain protein
MSKSQNLTAVEEELPQRKSRRRMSSQMQLEIEMGRSLPQQTVEEVKREALWGDRMITGKDQCRVVFNNVQGISAANDGIEISKIGKEVMDNEVTILGMCEANRNWQDTRAKSEVTRRFRDFWKMTHIATSSSTEHTDRPYQPGGTMTVVGEPWACRAKAAQKESDMGRWNQIAISGRKGKSVMVVTADRVCKNSVATAGPTTSFAQQWHILRCMGDKTPDPRKQFIKDLEK